MSAGALGLKVETRPKLYLMNKDGFLLFFYYTYFNPTWMETRIIKLRQIGKKQYSLIELLMVMAVICILFAIMLSGLFSAKRSANAIDCRNNQRSISQAVFMFADENDGQIKPNFRVSAVFNIDLVYEPYLGDANAFHCSESDNDEHFAYIKGKGAPCDFAVFSPYSYVDAFKLAQATRPASYRLVGEAYPCPTGYFWFDKDICRWDMSARWRHNNKMNVVFMDGSALSEGPIDTGNAAPPYVKE